MMYNYDWINQSKLVLIVPLWNWNSRMVRNWPLPFSSSNRTFMELKYRDVVQRHRRHPVLIVPLWNWNVIYLFTGRAKGLVLIVPLWNWNFATAHTTATLCCSNRTFMELKWYTQSDTLMRPLGSNRTFMELKYYLAMQTALDAAF